VRKTLKNLRIRVKDLSVLVGMTEQGVVRWKNREEVPKHIAEYLEVLTLLPAEERDEYLKKKLS
jgi:nitrate reductase assembly molybdenum cofactor insertion protein NarJ